MKYLILLTVILTGLKVLGYITWNWFVVLLPILIVPILFIVVLLLAFVLGAINDIYEDKKPRS
jgi:ABC-type uncharacterized transport system permease subunit